MTVVTISCVEITFLPLILAAPSQTDEKVKKERGGEDRASEGGDVSISRNQTVCVCVCANIQNNKLLLRIFFPLTTDLISVLSTAASEFLYIPSCSPSLPLHSLLSHNAH